MIFQKQVSLERLLFPQFKKKRSPVDQVQNEVSPRVQNKGLQRIFSPIVYEYIRLHASKMVQ